MPVLARLIKPDHILYTKGVTWYILKLDFVSIILLDVSCYNSDEHESYDFKPHRRHEGSKRDEKHSVVRGEVNKKV